nr:hypothetical protein [Selenomonas noxia]
MVNAVAYSEQQLSLFEECEYARGGGILGSLSGKTSLVHSAATKELILEPCLKKSDRPKFQYLPMENGRTQDWQNCLSVTLHGASSMLNIGECPNVAVESFLSQILQPTEDVPEKYYLSPKACQGILRRTQERGKELPEELRIALERQAGYTDLTHGQA